MNFDELKGKTQEELNRIEAQGKAAEDKLNEELDRVVFQINNFRFTINRKHVRIALGVVVGFSAYLLLSALGVL